jgi:hypothetical protein
MVPRVAINAGSFAFEIRIPLIRPMLQQHSKVIRIAGTGPIFPAVIKVADIMQDIPATEPIDKSIPPVINTNDCPMPMIKIGAT